MPRRLRLTCTTLRSRAYNEEEGRDKLRRDSRDEERVAASASPARLRSGEADVMVPHRRRAAGGAGADESNQASLPGCPYTCVVHAHVGQMHG